MGAGRPEKSSLLRLMDIVLQDFKEAVYEPRLVYALTPADVAVAGELVAVAQGIELHLALELGVAYDVYVRAEHDRAAVGRDALARLHDVRFEQDFRVHAVQREEVILHDAHAVPRRKLDEPLLRGFAQFDSRAVFETGGDGRVVRGDEHDAFVHDERVFQFVL